MDSSSPRKTLVERLSSALPFEEVLGMNLFAKIGIVLLVLGFAFLGQLAFTSMGPAARSALIFAVGAAMLGGGIYLEGKERYRIIGRAGIGGGWALLFFTAYAAYHVAAMRVLASNTLDCILMLLVAGAMVAHTLRYKSQVVTGLAFLLAFSTVALSQDSVYALAAGVILALSIVTISLRMCWYELEIFGIVAGYANHFYWLYKLFPEGAGGHAFPQFWPSAIILVLYWATFRISYVIRRIRDARDEKMSSLAAVINPILLLVVMKFQSVQPELAFYALLGLGAVEFFFGQLKVTRRRRPAFILLTVLGTLLMFSAVPFKFSGNSIALFWIIAAEALLVAGISQAEVVFRRLGLIAGVVTGLLVAYEARGIVDFRQHSNQVLLQNGILLFTCSVLFCFNPLFIRNKWKELFSPWDGLLGTAEGYLGALTAFLGVWALCPGDWSALGWAALMLAAAFGARRLGDKHLVIQATALAIAVVAQGIMVNCHFSIVYPHHLAMRFIALPALALLFYAAAWLLSGVEDLQLFPHILTLWAGTVFLALLAWLDLSPYSVAPVWMLLAALLALVARRISLRALVFQEHALAVAAAAQLFTVNLEGPTSITRYVPLLACAGCLYAISRFCTLPDAVYRRSAAWAHTWAATALLAALAWHETPQPWLAAIWAVFALVLALVDRILGAEELPLQAHLLALLAVLRAVTLNMFNTDKWHAQNLDLDLRLVTVAILVAVLYALAYWLRWPDRLRNTDARHVYTWVGSALAAWLLWCELQPIAVAVGLAIFGLFLFEWGEWRRLAQIRVQAYAALAAAFARIFFVNLTAASIPGEWISPRTYTVAPIAFILFYVWARLQSDESVFEISGWSARDLIAYFGTGSVAALLYYQTPAEWIVVALSALVLALLIASFALDKEIFLHHAVLLVVATAVRGEAHNIFGSSYFGADGWRGSFLILAVASALLLAGLPIAFRLRLRYAERPVVSSISRYLAVNHMEQWLFFAPLALLACAIAVKMNPGMITLSWGMEALLAIVLGLAVSQRSYRIAGLSLLLLCVGKVVALDVWRLGQRDRYITFIALGAALILVSTLYSRFRESVRRLL